MLLVLVFILFDKINVNRKLHNIFNIIKQQFIFSVQTHLRHLVSLSQLKTPSR